MSEWFDAEAHADRALEMYERGRWAEAESELRKAIALNPDQAEWHYNLALTLEAGGRDEDALASYERAIELIPEQVEPLVSAAVVSNRLNQPGPALQWLDRALALAPDCESAFAHKIDALIRLGDHDEAEAIFYLAQHTLAEPSAHCFAAMAESLMERKQFERAGWCLREALKLEPQMPRLRARLAAVLAAIGKHQRAQQMYLRDLRDDPGNIDTLLDYGDLLITLGRLPDAAEKFRRVLEQEPANVEAHFQLGRLALLSGRLESANLEFELALHLDGQYPFVRLWLCDVLIARNQIEQARQHLRDELELWSQAEQIEIAPTEEDCERFGRLLLDADMPGEAAIVLERAIEEIEQSAALLRKLALARFHSGDVDGGAAASRRVLRFDPACVVSMHNLALAALQSGQLRVAAGWIARGLRVDRHDDGLRRLRVKLWIAMLGAWIKR